VKNLNHAKNVKVDLLKIVVEEIRVKAVQISDDSEYIGALIENKPIEALWNRH
jgi:hypothetical protein